MRIELITTILRRPVAWIAIFVAAIWALLGWLDAPAAFVRWFGPPANDERNVLTFLQWVMDMPWWAWWAIAITALGLLASFIEVVYQTWYQVELAKRPDIAKRLDAIEAPLQAYVARAEMNHKREKIEHAKKRISDAMTQLSDLCLKDIPWHDRNVIGVGHSFSRARDCVGFAISQSRNDLRDAGIQWEDASTTEEPKDAAKAHDAIREQYREWWKQLKRAQETLGIISRSGRFDERISSENENIQAAMKLYAQAKEKS